MINKTAVTIPLFATVAFGMAAGTFWFVWDKLGFWWGLVYGVFWTVYVGFKIAGFLWGLK